MLSRGLLQESYWSSRLSPKYEVEGREQAAEELLDRVVVEFEDEYGILLFGARFSTRSLRT